MRAHQAIGMDLDLTPTDGTCQTRQEKTVVLPALEERPTRDRAVEDVVPTAGLVLTGEARHGPRDAPAEEWTDAGGDGCRCVAINLVRYHATMDAQKSVGEGAGEPGFDARLERLQSIVSELEQGELGLEPAIERYQEGIELLKACHGQLQGYRKQVEELSADAEASLRPYEADPDFPSD